MKLSCLSCTFVHAEFSKVVKAYYNQVIKNYDSFQNLIGEKYSKIILH